VATIAQDCTGFGRSVGRAWFVGSSRFVGGGAYAVRDFLHRAIGCDRAIFNEQRLGSGGVGARRGRGGGPPLIVRFAMETETLPAGG
jgi:hypothetical protein